MMKPMKTHIFTVTSSSKAATIYRNLPLSSWPLGPWEILRCIENLSTEIVQVTPGWWLTYPSEKYEFVSWDDDIPNIWKVIKFMFQTTNQYW